MINFCFALGYTIESIPPPGSGPIVLSILNILEGYESLQKDKLTYHRLIEAYKFGYAQREKLADPMENTKAIEEAVKLILRYQMVQMF